MAIEACEKFYRAQQKTTKTITALSNKLNKTFDLTDKKAIAFIYLNLLPLGKEKGSA